MSSLYEAYSEERFLQLQQEMVRIWREAVDNPYAEQTVVVVPSMSLDEEELHKLKGVVHYEERLLFFLILLRMLGTRLVFVTSEPIDPAIVEYYLQMLPGIPLSHARKRLFMLSARDSSVRPLTQKILERPSLIQRIKNFVGDSRNVHLTVFNVTDLERRLSVALGIPLFGPRPDHLTFGQKSGSRKLFREVGISHPDGFEDLRDAGDIASGVAELYLRNPNLKRVVIKLNEGFSGDGNAIYPTTLLEREHARGALTLEQARRIVAHSLPSLTRFQARGVEWPVFLAKFEQMQGVVECFIEGRSKTSPSVQLRLTPLGETEIVSTHDQILGGPGGQVFMGCSFPARREYRMQLHEEGRKVGAYLAARGVWSRLSVDFVAVARGRGRYELYAVEINLRKGGTTHPFRTLQLLTGGAYYEDRGLFVTGSGDTKFYVASDNLESPRYVGLLPEDLIDITAFTRMHYRSSTNTGSVFHMIGALSQFGKVGVTCIGNSPRDAQLQYERTVDQLDEQVKGLAWLSRFH